MSQEEFMKLYFQKKKELSKRILEGVTDPEGKEKVKKLLELF